jgi:hypothetical protein
MTEGRYWTDDSDDLAAEVEHWRDAFQEDAVGLSDDDILGILQRQRVRFRRQQMLTRAERWGLAVLGVLVGLSQIAQGVAAVVEAVK